jgi:hypothetical protein
MEQQEYILTIEEKPKYLYVRASGKRSNETIKSITIKVFNTAIEKKLSIILIDVRELIGSFGYMEILLYVGKELDVLRGKGVNQVAIIDIKRSPIQGFFLESVAQNHGFNFRVFELESEAVKWLGY